MISSSSEITVLLTEFCVDFPGQTVEIGESGNSLLLLFTSNI